MEELIYNIDFEITSLIFTIFLFIEVLRTYPRKKYKERTFVFMVVSVIVTTAFDLLTAYTNTYTKEVPIVITWLANYGYFASGLIACFLFYYYIEICIVPKEGRRYLLNINKNVLLVSEIFMISNFFNKLFFYVTADGKYLAGPLYLLMHATSLFFVVCGSITLLVNNDVLSSFQKKSGYTFILIYFIAVVLQTFFFRDILIIMPAASLMLVVAYFTLESPDYPKLQKTIQELSLAKQKLEESNNNIIHLTYNDVMSNLLNRTAFNAYLEELENNPNKDQTMILIADINGLKNINDKYGRRKGDEAIIEVADLLKKCFVEKAKHFRISGDEFAVIVENVVDSDFTDSCNMLINELEGIKNKKEYDLSISMGYQKVNNLSVSEAINKADQKMHQYKKDYRLAMTSNKKTLENNKEHLNKTILIIEDSEILRELLTEILNPYYNILEAENGQAGLDILGYRHDDISLIMLDIQMPVMNGYEFLEKIQEQENYRKIPVIVTTSSDSVNDEIKCLEMGASDFVYKPYNPDIIIRRTNSIIRLRETTLLLDKVIYDELTGLYSKQVFYQRAKEKLMSADIDESFDMCCFDIESFKSINDQYGNEKADELLKYMSKHIGKVANKDAICGRLDNEILACMCPHHEKETYDRFVYYFNEIMKEGPIKNVVVRIGAYLNISRSISMAMACDNALMAISKIKHTYGNSFAIYEESTRQKLLYEQKLFNNMEKALVEKEFFVYFQEKRDLETNLIGGAEALIRWISPELGFLSPGLFIPLFEKNGFIMNLDIYMIEETCNYIRTWIDENKKVVPISINISRVSAENPNLLEIINSIVDKNNIPHEFIHFEVTESAYVEEPKFLLRFVNEIKESGYKIELDDFGAGYSSLKALVDIKPDILKLDMSVTQNLESPERKIVVQRIVQMANDIKMKTVAEGVETVEQAQVLKELGCTYGQGYLYSRPISKVEFEKKL